MRRLLTIVLLSLALFAAFYTTPSPAKAAGPTNSCQGQTGISIGPTNSAFIIGPGIFTTTYNPAESLIISVVGSGSTPATQVDITNIIGTSAPGIVSLPWSIVANDMAPNDVWAISSVSPSSSATFTASEHCRTCLFEDGRLNACDAAETVAVYCKADGSVAIWAIDNSEGKIAFIATPAEIAKVSTKPKKNTVIKSGDGATLYRLTSGELVVFRNEPGTGKPYHFIFNDCPKP